MRDLGFACILLLLLPLAAVSAFVGVLLWVWVAMLSPSDSLTGFMAGVQLNKIVFAIVVLSLMVSKERKVLYLDLVGFVMLAFCASATMSFVTSISSPDLANEIYQKLLKEVVLAFCIMFVMTSRNRLQMLALTVLVALSFIGVKEGLIGVLTAGGHQITGIGSVGDNNALATALLMMAPLGLYASRHMAVRPVKLAILAAVGLSLITVLLTKSRGGFGGLVILALLFILRSDRKFLGLAVVGVVAAAVLFLAPPEMFSRLNTVENLQADGSAVGRFVAWKVSLLIALAHPLFGGGGHSVQYYPVWNSFVPYIGSVDFITTPMIPTYAVAAHSIYFEILGDNGFLGLFLFLSMIAVTLFNCLAIRKMAKPYPELRWARELAQAAAMSLVLYVTTGALLSMGYFELTYIVVGMVSACRRVVREAKAELDAKAEAARPGWDRGRPVPSASSPGVLVPGARPGAGPKVPQVARRF